MVAVLNPNKGKSVRKVDLDQELSGTTLASQNRNDRGGRNRDGKHSVAEIAGFFVSPAAKTRKCARFWGLPSKSQEARSDHGHKSPQLRDFVAATTTGGPSSTDLLYVCFFA